MGKYMLSEDTKKIIVGDDKITLHRIIATSNFADVTIGDKGGWVASERNLSQAGLSWIYDDSTVFSDAVVSGDAVVQLDSVISGQASITDRTIISRNSKVSGSVAISGDSYLTDDAVVTGSLVIKNSLIMGPREISGSGYIKDITMRLVLRGY